MGNAHIMMKCHKYSICACGISLMCMMLFSLLPPNSGSLSHWFKAIANGEPSNTYLKIACTDLARTCEAIESHRTAGSDGDDALYLQNLQSIADYVHSAQVCSS